MNYTRKLSLFIAIVLLLQLGLPGWPAATQKVSAASSGPVPLSFSPADDLTNVPLGTNLKITFDEKVRQGASTAYITIYESEFNKEIERISATSGQVYINSSNQSEVTITRSTSSANKFVVGKNYYVLIDSGAFLNESNGAAYSGIYDATKWNFRTVTTEDTTKPTDTLLEPLGTAVPITTPIKITFSEPVFAVTGSIELRSTDDVRMIPVTSSDVTGSGTTQIIIQPAGALLPSTDYTVKILGNAFQDASGNTYNEKTWSFTTTSAPVNLANGPFTPADNASQVPTNSTLVVKFDKAVEARPKKYVEIRQVNNNKNFVTLEATSEYIKVNNNEVTIDPLPSFEANTAYYVLIDPGAFTEKGSNGNLWFYGISAATIWNFTTSGNDSTPPQYTALTPAPYGTVNGVNSQLTMTFNEPVYPNSGNIEIRQSLGGALFKSIPITSTNVTGGGSNTLKIDPGKSFVNNTRYYVTIGNRVIRDAAVNFYSGIEGSSGWSFTVTQDSVRPTLNTVSPVNNAVAVGLQAEFTATFSKPIMTGNGKIKFIPAGSSSLSEIEADFWVDPADNKRMIMKPKQGTSLWANTNYYINIDEDAITDLVGNQFVGILNQYQWTFQTVGGDKTAPTISKTEASGSIVRLIYNEPLNANLKPSPASYYVTVNGMGYPITNVAVAGNTVSLTLLNSVGSNQLVKVSYTKPTEGLVQDISGNQAASFANIEVTNGFTNTVPAIVGGSVSGDIVTLNFNQPLTTVNSYAYSQFIVNVGGTNYFASSISNSGNSVTLRINGSVPSNQTVLVSYTPGAYPLSSLYGVTLNAFSNYNLATGTSPGNGDTQAPFIQAITASATIVTITYNKVLSSYNVPAIYQYSVLVDGVVRTVSSVRVSGNTVILTLSTNILSNQSVKVSYYATSNTLTDLYGNPAASFSNISANGNIGTGQPGSLQGAILKGALLTLTFNETLNPSIIPSSSLFVVRINDLVRIVTNVQVIGNSVKLTLSTPSGVGDRATLSYYPNDYGLKTLGGQAVSSISNTNVANQTTLLDTLTGDYEPADDGGVGLKTSATTISSDQSPAGVTASRYTILNDKFILAVTTSRNAGLANPRIVFKVPSYEKAAIVGISVIALEMANKQGGNVTIAVQHNDTTFELPLDTLNFSELSSMVGGNGVSNQLLIYIDQGASNKTAALTTVLRNSKANIISGPVNYEVMIANGANKQTLNNFSGYVSRTMKTTASVNTSETSVVWLDPETNTLSYVPTRLVTFNGVTTATFKRKGNSAYALVRNTSSFTDVSKHWAVTTINTMARKYIVEGKTSTKFEPDKNITRGEFATYIAKGLGLQGDKAAAAKFKDVTSNTAMGAYIGAAVKAGIVKGNTDGTFKPNNPVTRQDMAAMMMRAAKVAELTVSPPNSTASYLQNFTDKGKISSYAKTDVAHAVYLGIITGKNAKTLSPLTNATRAEGTVMLMRLLEKAKFLTP